MTRSEVQIPRRPPVQRMLFCWAGILRSMKLFLSSVSIAQQNQQAFIELVGKAAKDIRVALIENWADTYPDDHKQWVDRARMMIQDTVGEIVTFDLRRYIDRNDLEADLAPFDVIWIGGGNVYYLRWISHESGFDSVIARLVEALFTVVIAPELSSLVQQSIISNPQINPRILLRSS
jgi:hypothetical protein